MTSKFSKLDGTVEESPRLFHTEALPENPEITRPKTELHNTADIILEADKQEELWNDKEHTNIRKQIPAIEPQSRAFAGRPQEQFYKGLYHSLYSKRLTMHHNRRGEEYGWR